MKEIGVKPRELLSIWIVEFNEDWSEHNWGGKKRCSNKTLLQQNEEQPEKKEHYAAENAWEPRGTTFVKFREPI